MDADWLTRPAQVGGSAGSCVSFCLSGLISSIFDYLTFFMMLYVFNCWDNPALFHTGWFVESLFTQTLIIHVIRTNKIPFLQSWASWPLIVTSIMIVTVGALLTISPLADALGFVPLPPLYWLLLAIILVCYVVLTQLRLRVGFTGGLVTDQNDRQILVCGQPPPFGGQGEIARLQCPTWTCDESVKCEDCPRTWLNPASTISSHSSA